jgi:hypothetical protein
MDLYHSFVPSSTSITFWLPVNGYEMFSFILSDH